MRTVSQVPDFIQRIHRVHGRIRSLTAPFGYRVGARSLALSGGENRLEEAPAEQAILRRIGELSANSRLNFLPLISEQL